MGLARLSVVCVADGCGRFRGLAWVVDMGGSELLAPPMAPPDACREVFVLVAMGIFQGEIRTEYLSQIGLVMAPPTFFNAFF